MEFSAEEVDNQTFQKCVKKWKTQTTPPILPKTTFESLSEKQKYIVSLIKTHVSKSIEDQINSQIKCIIQGDAGVGESELISHLKYIFDMQKQECSDFDYVLASLTGTASFLIRGETIHSSFLLPIYKKRNQSENQDVAEDLNGEGENQSCSTLSEKQREKLKNVRIICIDEFSLIGQNMLKEIDLILKKVDPLNSDKPFASKSIILVGDIYQNFAIGDSPCFYPSNRIHNSHLRDMYKIYKSFDTVVILDKQYRHSGSSEEQLEFLQFLGRLKRRECVQSDLDFVRSRQLCNLSDEEKLLFQDAIHVYPLRKLVREYNGKKLRSLYSEKNIVCIENGIRALDLAVGAKIILQRNVCVRVGLSNGSHGHIVDIVYESKSKNSHEGGSVHFLLIHFPQYSGDAFVTTSRGRGVPIFRQHDSEFNEVSGRFTYGKRFCLELGYALTAHRSQGKTLERVAIYLDQAQFCCGIDYVCWSRTKSPKDICVLDEYITKDRILSPAPTGSPSTLQKYEERRLMKLQSKVFE